MVIVRWIARILTQHVIKHGQDRLLNAHLPREERDMARRLWHDYTSEKELQKKLDDVVNFFRWKPPLLALLKQVLYSNKVR